MKKHVLSTLLIFPFAFSVSTALAQSLNENDARTPSRCAAVVEFNEHAKSNPALLEERRNFDLRTEELNLQNRTAGTSATSSVPRVIPVVVHVLHECGAENITKAQILDGIRVLNEDYRRTNADAAFTPVPFQSVAADCNIEFRLAQLDPNGNCTDGIVRIETIRTNNWVPRDSLKRVSYWPTDKYLNIWLVKGISDANNTGGTILGYAHFPWDNTHRAITDGVVVRHDYFGSIGTAVNSGNSGRVATHEVGHWLGLYHIWGDDNGACYIPPNQNTDFCGDTPDESDQIFGCPGGSAATAQFPYFDGCTSSGNGIMYMNYMDYTDGECQNLFTNDQKNRMSSALTSYRPVLTSPANLAATGTNGATAVVCAPKAAVCQGSGNNLCQHGSISFNSTSYNADTILSYSWQFPGGNPSTSTDSIPSVTYDTVGVYGYSLTVTSSGGSDSIYYSNAVTVHGPPTIFPFTVSTMEDFELASSFPGDGYVINKDKGITWQRVTTAGYSGVASLFMNNFVNFGSDVDKYITPAYDIHNLVGVLLKFRVANAQSSATSNDELNVYVSTNCGLSWGVARKRMAGAALATAGVLTTPFTPTSASQWRLIQVSPAATGASNIRFMFENVCDRGNNTYIDDINITASSVVGIEETAFETAGFQVYPNPASGLATVRYNLATNGYVELTLLDPLGREVRSIVHDKKELGIHEKYVDLSDLSKGIYFLNLKTPNSSLTTKLIVK